MKFYTFILMLLLLSGLSMPSYGTFSEEDSADQSWTKNYQISEDLQLIRTSDCISYGGYRVKGAWIPTYDRTGTVYIAMDISQNLFEMAVFGKVLEEEDAE